MTTKNDKAASKPKISAGISIGGNQRIDMYSLRQRALSDPGTFCERMIGLADEGKWRWEDVSSLKDMWHALRDIPVRANIDISGRSAPITTGAFPLLTGALTVAGLNRAYEMVETVGQDLVTDFESNKSRVTVAGVLSQGTTNDRVEEGQEFPLIGASQERYDIGSLRKGVRMQITAEMIEENDLPEVINRVNALGEIPAEAIEEQTLKRVTDYDGSAATPGEPYVLKINNAGAALFQTANTTLTRLGSSGNRHTNNALVDSSDLDNARSYLAAMTNSRGKRLAIPISRMKLLVPDALLNTALKIQGSDLEPGIQNELNNWGPRGRWRPMLLSTPKLDDLSASAWYLGDFQSQFRRKWKLRMEIATLTGNDTENWVRRRVAFESRVAWDVEIGAVDYVYVIQNLTGTTTPKDE